MSYFPMFYAGLATVGVGCFMMALAMHGFPSSSARTTTVHVSHAPIYEALPTGNVRVISTPPN